VTISKRGGGGALSLSTKVGKREIVLFEKGGRDEGEKAGFGTFEEGL